MKRILLVLLGLFIVGTTLAVTAYALVSVPKPNDLANAQASIVYYADGKSEMARFKVVNRESVPLSKIPPHVQHALLAAEDRTFYQNNGISPTGLGRAVMVALKGGPTQGGSTITQQYVKNYFLTQDQTLTRKAKEFIISIKIDQQESKDKILENYLNTIYYGRGATGIQTASRAYFGKDASKLTVSEGALLASVIRGPAFYDPRLGPEQKASAEARVKYVLDGMVSKGWLTSQQRAETAFPKTIPIAKEKTAGTVGYIKEAVRQELTDKLKLSDKDINTGGLKIVTTINKKAQVAAVKAVADNAPSDPKTCGSWRNNADKRGEKRPVSDCRVHTALTAIKPGDGAIVAMYGGKDYSKEQWNYSTQATMQGGSTFKVFGVLAALQNDISTKKTYKGGSPQFFPEFEGNGNSSGKVPNFGNAQYGRITLRNALAHSVNTVFAQLNIELADGKTASAVKDAAILAGVPKNTPGLGTDITNILGTASPHIKDMANAYATIAAQGKRATPYLISKVTTADGHIDYRVKKGLTKAFDKDITADATEAMTHVLTEGTAAVNAQGLGRPAAGKTGTTDQNLAILFDGFTPQLSAAVGIVQGGGTESIRLKSGIEATGGGFPVKIWTAFMKGALDGEKVIAFPPRQGVGDSNLPPPPPPPPVFTPAPAPEQPVASEPPPQQVPTSAPAPVPEPPAPTFTNGPPEPGPNPRPTRTRKPKPGGPPPPELPPATAPAVP
jgi:membrane peptidoglycan carboxypeptidase